MFIHVFKCKNLTNIYQASLNKVFIMQSYFLFHFTEKNKINNKIFMKTKRLGVKLKLQ